MSMYTCTYIYIQIYIYKSWTLKSHMSFPNRCICSNLTKEHELYRVFDSLVFEDEDVHTREEGIDTRGDMNPDQTKDLM